MMIRDKLNYSDLSTVFETLSMMTRSSIQLEEAVLLLVEDLEDGKLKEVMSSIYRDMITGIPFCTSAENQNYFPDHAINMLKLGTHSGRLDDTLESLAVYYENHEQMRIKMRSSVFYPAILLVIMSFILAMVTFWITPIFINVYEAYAGGVSSGSSGFVVAGLILGRFALVVCLITTFAALFLTIMSYTTSGNKRLIAWSTRFTTAGRITYRLALSHFTSLLSTLLSAGEDIESSFKNCAATVTHPVLKTKVDIILQDISNPSKNMSLAQSIQDNQLFDSIYSRMFLAGSLSGNLDEILYQTSALYSRESANVLDSYINNVEPILTSFLTFTVATTLISLMLPLISIMSSIG